MWKVAAILALADFFHAMNDGNGFLTNWNFESLPPRAVDWAFAVFLLSMASVVTWLTLSVKSGLRHPTVFRVM